VPDKNLGNYIAKKVPEKRMIIWDGYCVTHHRVTLEDVQKAKKAHPDAVLLVHPECRPEVVELADFVGSTRQIIDFAAVSKEKKFIIGTEMGVLYSLKRNSPEKTFYLLSPGLICPNMKKTRLESVYNALKQMRYTIELEEEIMIKARTTLERMLKVE
jgi:quinolinate synthase